MIFVTKDFGIYEGESGYKFFPDIESAKLEMLDEEQAFFCLLSRWNYRAVF